MNKDEREEIKRLPLREILESKHGITFNKYGFALCPFHKEARPSFQVSQKNGYWRWHCYGKCQAGGDYIDFRMKKDNTDFNETVRNIQSENSLKFQIKSPEKVKAKMPIATYVYKDEDGNAVYRKLKYENKTYAFERLKDGKWKLGLNNTRRLLYNLPELKDSGYVFYLEGEKDCETLKGLGFITTTAGSVNSWNEDFVKYFKDKEVFICLDVGNEEAAEKTATDLLKVTKQIKILKLPGLTEREQDITDWIEMMGDVSIDEKKTKLTEVIINTPYYETKKESIGSEIETIREFRLREIPAREVFLQSWLERESLTILGGEQKVGKSVITLNIATSLALGRDFLGFEVPKPRKILLYQQEISAAAMKERTDKVLKNKDSALLDNFLIKNTTGSLIKITKPEDRKQLHKNIEEYKPDLVIFDPLSTFHDKKENDAREMSELLGHFFEIMRKFKVGILIVHHYGKPSMYQRQGGHLLRGHTIIGDRADSIIVFNKLPEKCKKSPLPLPYDHYAEIQFVLRNDAAPDNIVVERNPEDLWSEVPPKIYGSNRLSCLFSSIHW